MFLQPDVIMKNIILIILFLFVAGCSVVYPKTESKFKTGDLVHYINFPEVKCVVKYGPWTYKEYWSYELVCKSKNQENSILQDRKALEWEIEKD